MENNQEFNANEEFQKEYSKPKFWEKIDFSWKKAGKKVVETAIELFLALQDKDTPRWAKAVIIGALGYFITPIDAIPDFAPLVGFSDDLGVMLSALAVVAIHIKEEHKEKARQVSSKIFKD